MSVYKGLDREEIEAQYFLRGTRPGYEERDIPRWLARSQQFRERSKGQLDLVYGPQQRNTLDVFQAEEAETGQAGLIFYIHGGYWQRGDKSVYSFIAEPFVKRGFHVALMNYQMCPDVRMSEIAPQARLAVTWLWRNADSLGFDRDHFTVMGHSAGGHLTIEMMATDWTTEGADLPSDLVKSGIAVSGIYDFEPILYCSENGGLCMDETEAHAVSPIHRMPPTTAPILIAHGMNEPSDMHRQSQEMYECIKTSNRQAECFSVPRADHFETVDVLADPASELHARALKVASCAAL